MDEHDHVYKPVRTRSVDAWLFALIWVSTVAVIVGVAWVIGE